MSRKDNSLSSTATEVRYDGIVLRINWEVLHHLAFYGLLVVITVFLALDGTLLRSVLEQILMTALAVYLAKGHL